MGHVIAGYFQALLAALDILLPLFLILLLFYLLPRGWALRVVPSGVPPDFTAVKTILQKRE